MGLVDGLNVRYKEKRKQGWFVSSNQEFSFMLNLRCLLDIHMEMLNRQI